MSTDRISRLLAAALVLAACEPGPERPAASRANEVALPRPTDTVPAVRDSPSVDRTPETDPWLLEGIPNFEDLVAGRDGDWVVVLGSSERTGARPAPTVVPARDAGLAAAQQRAWNAGRVPFIVASEDIPGLEPGFTVLVLGPFARAQAERELAALAGVIPDAYLRQGW